MEKKNLLEIAHKNYIAPIVTGIIVGIIVFFITNACNKREINELKTSAVSLENTIKSLDSTIRLQQDSLSNNKIDIERLETKLRDYTNVDISIGGDVNGGEITGIKNHKY